MTTVSYEVDGGVAVLTLNRPEVLNAFNDEMGAAALGAVQQAAGDDQVRCLVVTGAGRAFCAGEDLAPLAADYQRGVAPELGNTLVDRYNPLIRAIRGAPKPVIAAINGVAAGAGASLALACDVRLAVSEARLILAFVKVGLVPDSGALWFLTKMIGSARALRYAMSGEPIDAATGSELGIIDEVIEAEAFEETWRSRARALAEGPTKAYALIKQLAADASEVALDDQLDREVVAQSAAGSTADHIEGVTAFFEKRRPDFTGR